MTAIPCPAWCTNHHSNGSLEDEIHETAIIELIPGDAMHHSVQISKSVWGTDQRVIVSWHTDGDTASSAELRTIALGLLRAADQYDAIVGAA
jgi:hypothetical protein